jgi:hypothetical protein
MRSLSLSWSLLLAAVLSAVACTKPNPAVCCLDTADCSEVGIGEVRTCAAGLACVDHQCEVPSCAAAGCAAAAPVCNTTTDVCDPCASVDDCSRFGDTPVCETTSGGCVQCLASSDCTGRAATPVCDTVAQSCVECVAAADCPATKAVCDVNACRAPRVDDECPSGALADEGCVAEADAVYLDPNGSDVGSCTRPVPCKTLAFAVSVTTAARNHIVFKPGQYSSNEESYDSSDTQAPALYFHGHGAEILGPTGGDGCVMGLGLSTTVRDLRVTVRTSSSQTAICVGAGPTLLERVETTGGSGSRGIQVSAAVTVREYSMSAGYEGISVVSGSLTLERAVIHGVRFGVVTQGPSTIQLSNLLVYGTTDRALNLVPGTSGTVNSSTFVTDGPGFATNTRAVLCPSSVLIRSSIVWSPGAGALAPISGCNLTNVIAGPAVVAGASNADPKFVDLAQDNYHLGPSSPARDAVSSGPAFDFEGDARPQGPMFDIGADEAAP